MPTEIERLYREHRARLVRLVERELHDHHDAEDVVQAAFLDVQRALEHGTIPRHPRAWLAAIALNAGRRLRRRRLKVEPLEEYAVQESSGRSEVHAALASLPKEQRAAVLYRDVLGFSYGETAEQMGRSVESVTMLLHRARRRLRQTLGLTTGGLGLWRGLKRAGMAQATVAKGAAVVVAGAGLATGGIVVARVVAPIGTDAKAALATPSGSLTAAGVRTPEGTVAFESVRRHSRPSPGSMVSAAHGASQGSLSSSQTSMGDEQRLSPSLPVPAVALSVPTTATLPATVAATVTVSTPITTATVTTPTGITATTPITTVTVPIP